MVLGLLQTNAPPHPRYLTPIVPGIAIAAGVGLWILWKRRRSPVLAGALVLALGLGAGSIYMGSVGAVNNQQQGVDAEVLRRIADHIHRDDRALTGVRSVRVMSVDPSIRALPLQEFTEEEWVTYLTWPSDREVLDVMGSHDIGWLLLLTKRSLEVDYHNTWVEPVHGRPVRHADMIQRSPEFCPVLESDEYLLYRVGRCPS
jgi:hypothetical protein